MAARLVAAGRSARVSTAVWDKLHAGVGKGLDKSSWWQCVTSCNDRRDTYISLRDRDQIREDFVRF